MSGCGSGDAFSMSDGGTDQVRPWAADVSLAVGFALWGWVGWVFVVSLFDNYIGRKRNVDGVRSLRIV